MNAPTLTLANCHDTYTAVPALLGYRPETGLVVVAMIGDTVHACIRLDLPTTRDIEDFNDRVFQVLFGVGANACVLAIYGDPERAEKALAAAVGVADAWQVRILDVLRVTENDYSSGFCITDPGCPSGGHPLSAVAEPSTGRRGCAGRRRLPDAVAGDTAPWLKAAFDAELARLADLVATDAGGACDQIHAEGMNLLDEHATSTDLAAEHMAGLLLALIHPRIRDHGLMLTDRHGPDECIRTWEQLMSLAPAGFIAAPACLFAFAAWRLGDHWAARAGVERALADEPGGLFARFLREALDQGIDAARFPLIDPQGLAAGWARATA